MTGVPPAGALHPTLDADLLGKLVTRFYERAREDALLGPIFAQAVHDWPHHLATITDFWCSLMLRTGTYDGRPLPPHLRLQLEGKHFDRWLALFETTALEVCPAAAPVLLDRARRIADSFEMAIGMHKGELRRPRHAVRH